MKEKVFKTEVPLYELRFRLVLTDDIQASTRKRGIYDADTAEACTALVKDVVHIFLHFDATPGTVAHEALHAGVEVLKKCDVVFNKSNQESLAYLIGWITDWISEHQFASDSKEANVASTSEASSSSYALQ